MIPKREAELKSLFTQQLKHALPSFVTLLLATAGAPDRAVVGNGHTTFLEFKHGTPSFDSPGIQELTCMRLAQQGQCRYVIWQDERYHQRTLIVHPNEVHNRIGCRVVPEEWCDGFSMQFIIDYLKRTHGYSAPL